MIERLACKQKRNDEEPNIELAEDLCSNEDTDGILEIVGGLRDMDRAVANDCIKVLYEIGERKPELICVYANIFIACLRSKNNRLAWGSMVALAKIVSLTPEVIFEKLPAVITAYEEGSVITVDNSISVFAGLCKASSRYAETVLPIIIDHLETCRLKDIPQHAERASVCWTGKNAGAFTVILEKRMPDLPLSGQSRIKKLLKNLYGLTKEGGRK